MNLNIPESHKKFIEECTNTIKLMLALKPKGDPVPPIIMILSDNDETSLLTFDVNLMKSDLPAFEKMCRKKDEALSEQGFDVVAYVLVCEARKKVLRTTGQAQVNSVEAEDFEKVQAEEKDVVIMDVHGIGYNYIATFDLDTKKIENEIVNPVITGNINIFDQILNEKIKI